MDVINLLLIRWLNDIISFAVLCGKLLPTWAAGTKGLGRRDTPGAHTQMLRDASPGPLAQPGPR